MNKEEYLKLIFILLFTCTLITQIIAMFLIKDSLTNLDINNLYNGINNINSNLKSIDKILNKIDVNLIESVLNELNKTLIKGINPNIQLSINNNIPESYQNNPSSFPPFSSVVSF